MELVSSQFHYGSITTLIQSLALSQQNVCLNSTMVRLQRFWRPGSNELGASLNSTMVRLQPVKRMLLTKQLYLVSIPLWFDYNKSQQSP